MRAVHAFRSYDVQHVLKFYLSANSDVLYFLASSSFVPPEQSYKYGGVRRTFVKLRLLI